MSQTVLRLELPKGVRVYPSEFRESLARENSLSEAFFHRQHGATISGRPTIKTVGTKNWIGLVADDDQAAKLLYTAVAPAASIAARMAGSPCRMQIEERQFGISGRPTPYRYFIREMALKQRSKIRREGDIKETLAKAITQSIERTCDQMLWDCPSDLGVTVVDINRSRGLLLQTTSGVTKESVGLFDLEILVHAELSGYWFAGNLTSRGYGLVIKPRGDTMYSSTDRSSHLAGVLQ